MKERELRAGGVHEAIEHIRDDLVRIASQCSSDYNHQVVPKVRS